MNTLGGHDITPYLDDIHRLTMQRDALAAIVRRYLATASHPTVSAIRKGKRIGEDLTDVDDAARALLAGMEKGTP
jgi:hypothetical protein